MNLRDAIPADAPAIAAIYARHVLEGLGTFEEVPPPPEEVAARMAAVESRGLPWILAEGGDRIEGYAYATPYRDRSGYRFSVEDSVYVAHEAQGRGVGRALLNALIYRCTKLGFRQMIASIGDSENAPSIRLHEACGFEHRGRLAAVGFKHGRWVDVVWMQRPLG